MSSVRSVNMSDGFPFNIAPSKGIEEMYAPFVSEGFVSVDGKEKVLVKILWDTGAAESFAVESILPFSTQRDTGRKSPVLGIGLVPLWEPLHKIWYVGRLLWVSVPNGWKALIL